MNELKNSTDNATIASPSKAATTSPRKRKKLNPDENSKVSRIKHVEDDEGIPADE